MAIRPSDWMPQAAWFVAGIFATGALWYFLSKENYYATFVSALLAIVFVAVAIYLHRSTDKSAVHASHRDELARFLIEAQQLRSRLDEQPLPIAEHNAWVVKVSEYLRNNLGHDYEVRFSDFRGMVFYGDASEKSKMSRSLDGRSRRLHEFITQLHS